MGNHRRAQLLASGMKQQKKLVASVQEPLYQKRTPYRLTLERVKKEPVKSEARVTERHLNDWNLLNFTTSQFLYDHAIGGDKDSANLLFSYAVRSAELLRKLAFENRYVLLPIGNHLTITCQIESIFRIS